MTKKSIRHHIALTAALASIGGMGIAHSTMRPMTADEVNQATEEALKTGIWSAELLCIGANGKPMRPHDGHGQMACVHSTNTQRRIVLPTEKPRLNDYTPLPV